MALLYNAVLCCSLLFGYVCEFAMLHLSVTINSVFFVVIHHHTTITVLRPFFRDHPGEAGARRELLDFTVQRKINIGRHTNHPAGRHSIRTNQRPPPPSPIFYRLDALPATKPTVSKHWRYSLSSYDHKSRIHRVKNCFMTNTAFSHEILVSHSNCYRNVQLTRVAGLTLSTWSAVTRSDDDLWAPYSGPRYWRPRLPNTGIKRSSSARPATARDVTSTQQTSSYVATTQSLHAYYCNLSPLWVTDGAAMGASSQNFSHRPERPTLHHRSAQAWH